jgi:phosphoglucomutase
MSISPYAGKPAEPWMLTNIPRLVTAYYVNRPDPAVPGQRVAFSTSPHQIIPSTFGIFDKKG